MFYPINIIITIDSIAALSSGQLEDNLFMMDTSLNSVNQGSNNLSTHCYQGQIINWIIYAIDVQTPVFIKEISLIEQENSLENSILKASSSSDDIPIPSKYLKQYYWSGYIPFNLKGEYKYKLIIQIEDGKNGELTINTPSLNIQSIYGDEQ